MASRLSVRGRYKQQLIVEEKLEAKYDGKYDLFLRFHDKEDDRQFGHFIKNRIYAPVFWYFVILVAGIDMSRLSLTEMLEQGPWMKAACIFTILGIIVFGIFALSNFNRLTGQVLGERAVAIERIAHVVTKNIFRERTEDLITILFSCSICSFLIARILMGPCDDMPYETARAHINCNSEAIAHSPPIDTVIAAYVHPLMLQMAIKGISKWGMILAWAIATATVTWGVVHYQGFLGGVYTICDSLFFLLVIFETHRLKMLQFLQTKYELNIERKRRVKLELENKLRSEMLDEELLRKKAAEDEIARAEERLDSLPIHKAIAKLKYMDHLPRTAIEQYCQELLRIIHNNIHTVLERDHEGKTAFTLLIETPNADIGCINELLLYSLPINPLTEELIDPSEHDYAWTRTVQYERYEPCVKYVLASFPGIGPELAKMEDPEGREALHIASPKCKKAILSCIYFYRRYEIITLAQPHYQTKTSLVHLAIDHDSDDANKVCEGCDLLLVTCCCTCLYLLFVVVAIAVFI